jgi:acyl carrier protein phosphodiesterase
VNFLAHLSLSFDNEEWLIGNAIADFTRRKLAEKYRVGIQEGIAIHQFIDDFTDHHPVVKEMLQAWRPVQGKYAAVVNDIVMDHFLAEEYSRIADRNLELFAKQSYALFHKYWEELPPKAQQAFTYMEAGNWLVNYQYRAGLDRSLSGMSRRARNPNKMAEAVLQLDDEKAFFKDCFDRFYPDLEQATRKKSQEILGLKKGDS